MDKIYKELKVAPTKSGNYRLLESFKFKEIVVPKGYVTNGADIPRVFWSFIPPFQPEILPAVVIHDYLCDLRKYDLANERFSDLLEELNVKVYKRWVLVKAVEVFLYFYAKIYK